MPFCVSAEACFLFTILCLGHWTYQCSLLRAGSQISLIKSSLQNNLSYNWVFYVVFIGWFYNWFTHFFGNLSKRWLWFIIVKVAFYCKWWTVDSGLFIQSLDLVDVMIQKSVSHTIFCFKCLDMYTPTYSTPTFITEVQCLVTYGQLFQMIVKVK